MLIELITVRDNDVESVVGHVGVAKPYKKPDENDAKSVFSSKFDSQLISPDDERSHVSIGKLSNFIDFFNYVPFLMTDVKHKNDTSPDLYLYLGLNTQKSEAYMKDLSQQEKDDLLLEGRRFKKVLALISFKIHERFKTLLSAFRYFDSDHELSLTLNEFAQGIEHLRIKISFEYTKKIFSYLDHDNDGQIKFEDFRLLDEENWIKFDPLQRLYENMKNQAHEGSCRSNLP